MIRVLAVDPGYANFCHFIGDFSVVKSFFITHSKVLAWKNRRLVRGKYKLSKFRVAIRRWARRRATAIRSCQLVVIESQLKLRFINIQNAIVEAVREINPDCHIMLQHPTRVKAMFHTSTGSYRGNKRASVALVKKSFIIPPAKKLDDYADVLLMAYAGACDYLNNYPRHGHQDTTGDGGSGLPGNPLGVPDQVLVSPLFLNNQTQQCQASQNSR